MVNSKFEDALPSSLPDLTFLLDDEMMVLVLLEVMIMKVMMEVIVTVLIMMVVYCWDRHHGQKQASWEEKEFISAYS